jgi:hypothetical protein
MQIGNCQFACYEFTLGGTIIETGQSDMIASTSSRSVGGAGSHCTEEACCPLETCGPVEATPMHPRVLIVTNEKEMDDLVHQALEPKHDVNGHPGLDPSIDGSLADVDVAIVAASILGRIVPTPTAEEGERAEREELPISLDLKAVDQLGTILKGLSAHWRGRRHSIS